ncbi:MAG: glycosyltransferase [Lentisphaeraceae bacterium]|nr:glycosyltransferase [Lentisphaeraceae bacterium]
MKILHAVYNIDKYSGAAFQALDLCSWLKKNGIEGVSILNRSDGPCFSKGTLRNIPIKNINGNILKRTINTYRMIASHEVIHMHGFNFLVFIIASFCNRKILLKSTLLGWDDFGSLLKRRYGFILKLLMNRITVNNSLSYAIKSVNQKYLSDRKIVTVPNSVPVSSYNYFSLNKKSNTFIIVGAVVPRKRIDLAIKYYVNNYINLPDSKLFIIGPYDEGLSEFCSSYTETCLAYEKNFPGKILFLGKKTKEVVFDYMKKSKAMLFFPENEGFGSVIIEAQIHNCVPILTPFGGVEKDTVLDNENGFIIKDSTRKVSLKSIEKLLSDEKVSKDAYEIYKPDTVFSSYKKIYKEMLAE